MLAACAGLSAIGVAAIAPRVGADSPPPTAVAAQPELGAADLEMTLMGSAPQAGSGQTWGYRRLPLPVGPPSIDGHRLEFAPAIGNPPDPQLAFLRHSASSGWQYAETPLDEQGQAYRGFIPNRLSARITPHGGGLLIGRDPARAASDQVVVLRRNPGDRFRALPAPPPGTLLADEALAGDRGTGQVAVAAVEQNDRTGIFFAPVGREVEDAVVHFDGNAWSREPVEIPTGSEGRFEITALDATSPDNAWALAHTDPAIDRGLVLLQRVGGTNPRWVERSLDAPVFSAAGTPADGISAVSALRDASDPLTVTADGIWIDGKLRSATDGEDKDFTLYFDQAAGRVTSSWCDARTGSGALCDRPLGASFASQDGYQSIAWTGPGFGSRVITDALDPSHAADSNAGTYLRLVGGDFLRMPGAGGSRRRGGAFSSASEGWLDGPVHVTATPQTRQIGSTWPLPVRAPLVAVTPEPGKSVGALDSQALATGADGAVVRYTPGKGWQREFLLTAAGAVSKPLLRGVAWPEPGRAYAVGDLGAMWLWRSDTGLWEKDPAAPIGFEGNLMDVAFSPDGSRGYAVGKSGVLLSYGKTWSQDALPAEYANADLTQVAFAGNQAIVVAGGDLLTNDGSGWQVDQSAHDLMRSVPGEPRLLTVATLPDGGAVAAGEHIVIERNSPGVPWRFSDQPLPGATVVAAAAFRNGGALRAVVSVVPRLRYPAADILPPPDPNFPPPIVPPFPLPGDGYVLRQTDAGWRDEQHSAFIGTGLDRPVKSDPILDFALDASGSGWAVGGWSGESDSAGRGSSGRNPAGKSDRQRVQTAGAYRYGDGTQTPPTAAGVSPVGLNPGPARFLVAGHAQCEQACADLALQDIAPDKGLASAAAKAAELVQRGNGPRFLAYTGGRLPSSGVGRAEAEEQRYADLLGAVPGLSVFATPSGGESGGGAVDAYKEAFSHFASPFGSGPGPAGSASTGIPGASPGPGARTHYAFDTQGSGGQLRVIAIDNSKGSLAASDPHQNPAEPQMAWLSAVLADAKAKGLPSIVIGSRDLNSKISPQLNVASDANEVGKLLVDGGASAYFFDRPEENRAYRIPSGGAETIPAFGTGTIGYRSALSAACETCRPSNGSDPKPDALFGDAGMLLAEVDISNRDPSTNRAPVSVRMLPLIDDLSLLAIDGTLLRRSRPALFQGLGRKPLAGDRWGRVSSSDGNASPPGADPYVSLPPSQCAAAGCSTRIDPEFEFTSSDPDIGDFVKQDPNSTNLRKPFTDTNDKVVTDNRSGLFCPFNAGTTTVTARAGGLAYSQVLTVQAGSVQRPCGTRPLNASRFKTSPSKSPQAPPPPPPAGGGNPPVSLALPTLLPAAKVASKTRPPFEAPFTKLDGTVSVPVAPLPPPPPAVRPSPPGGGLGRAYQVEKKEEEEHATEESQAFSRYEPDRQSHIPAPYLVIALVLAALSGATLLGGARGRGGRRPAPAYANQPQQPSTRQYRRSRR